MEQENNNYKKDLLRLIIVFSAVLIISLTFFYLLVNKKLDELQNRNNKNDDLPAFEETAQNSTKYLLKEYNGKIGIFENEALIYTLDTYIFTLPEKDQKLLSEGISVSSKEELYEILEEYY